MATPNEPRQDPLPLEPAPRWVAPVFAILGAATLPWTVYLAMTLPRHVDFHHYRFTWVGFDVMLIVVLLATAYLAWRGNHFVGQLATIAATMLVLDAWFDVNTSNRAGRPVAILSAVLLELPLAAVCGWIALHVDHVIERRLRRLTRRAARLSAPSGAEPTTLARFWAAMSDRATGDRQDDTTREASKNKPTA